MNGIVAYLIVVIIGTAGLFTALMRETRPEPEPEPALSPAQMTSAVALLIRMSQRPAPVVPRDRYEPTPVHQYARLARECPMGVLTARAAQFAQTAIPYLADGQYEYPTGQFAAICGVG